MDETWLPIGGHRQPVVVVLGPDGTCLDLRRTGPGCDGQGWFRDLEAHGLTGVTTDDDPLYGPVRRGTGRAWQQCTIHLQRTVARRWRRLDPQTPTHRDRAVLPVLARLARTRPVAAGPRWPSGKPCARAGCGCLPPCGSCSGTCGNAGTTGCAARGIRPSRPREGWSGALWARFKSRARLARGFETEAGARNFVRHQAHAMA